MGFFNLRCPNCGKPVSKNAEFCNACGCPSATSFATCPRCAASVGADSQFCWKCGTAQDAAARRSIYYDRWQRSPGDFAVRVDLVIPDKALHHGLQVDEGTLALIFRNGVFQGTLEPGYVQFDNFFQRFLGADHGGLSHAILLDAQSAEVDFYLEGVATQDDLRIDMRLRVLFSVIDPKAFAERFLTGRTSFSRQDLADAFTGDVRLAVQEAFSTRTLNSLLESTTIRDLIETSATDRLSAAFAGTGLKTDGVRMADITGEVVESVRTKMAEFRRLTLERELDSKLSDALRADKVRLFKDEQELNDYYEEVTHALGFKSSEREQERKKFVLEAEKRLQLQGLTLDWSIVEEKLRQELEERRRRQQAELKEREEYLHSELHEKKLRDDLKRSLEVDQAKTDLEVARQGIEALKLVKQAKHEAHRMEEDLALEVEKHRLELRGNASMQALLATLDGVQAANLMKLAEMQMRQGMSVEQSLAFIAEKNAEFLVPAVAEALKSKPSSPPKP